jgi:DNA gyrase inhibitor GyrI
MVETFVEMPPIPVLRVRADWKGAGPAAAFGTLEAKLSSLKGRKFYGVFRETPDGEEYFACVARIEGEDPVAMGLDTGEIPGGWYARRRIRDWEKDLRQLAVQFKDMIRVLGQNVDRSRPAIEFYRSGSEMFVLEPVQSPVEPKTPDPPS